jgi:hypothetical protein
MCISIVHGAPGVMLLASDNRVTHRDDAGRVVRLEDRPGRIHRFADGQGCFAALGWLDRAQDAAASLSALTATPATPDEAAGALGPVFWARYQGEPARNIALVQAIGRDGAGNDWGAVFYPGPASEVRVTATTSRTPLVAEPAGIGGRGAYVRLWREARRAFHSAGSSPDGLDQAARMVVWVAAFATETVSTACEVGMLIDGAASVRITNGKNQ